MTFTATHARAFAGSDITVSVKAGDKDQIAAVTVTFDGEILEEQVLMSGTEEYTRSFAGVGSAQPGMDHTLVVTAMDAESVAHGATTRWSDV